MSGRGVGVFSSCKGTAVWLFLSKNVIKSQLYEIYNVAHVHKFIFLSITHYFFKHYWSDDITFLICKNQCSEFTQARQRHVTILLPTNRAQLSSLFAKALPRLVFFIAELYVFLTMCDCSVSCVMVCTYVADIVYVITSFFRIKMSWIRLYLKSCKCFANCNIS